MTSKFVKLFGGRSRTSSANIVKMHRIKNDETCSGSWFCFSSEREMSARWPATRVVTAWLTMLGSRDRGSVQMCFSRDLTPSSRS